MLKNMAKLTLVASLSLTIYGTAFANPVNNKNNASEIVVHNDSQSKCGSSVEGHVLNIHFIHDGQMYIQGGPTKPGHGWGVQTNSIHKGSADKYLIEVTDVEANNAPVWKGTLNFNGSLDNMQISSLKKDIKHYKFISRYYRNGGTNTEAKFVLDVCRTRN